MEDIEDREPSSFVPDNYKGITILVVDDDELYLTRIKLILEAFSYEVVTTAIPTEGLQMIQKDYERFQLVLANLEMKGMRKLSFLEILIENCIPVVAILGERRESYFGEIIYEGARWCMVKPNNWPSLKDIWQYANLKRRRSVAAEEVGPSAKKHKQHEASQYKDKGKEKEEVVREPENMGKCEVVRAPPSQVARESKVQVTVVGDSVVEWIAKPFKEGKGSGNIYDQTEYYYQIKAKYPLNKTTGNPPPAAESTTSGHFSTSSGADTNAISDKNTIALQHVSAPLQKYGAAVKRMYKQKLGNGSSSSGKSSTPPANNVGVTHTQGSYQGQNVMQAINYVPFSNQQIQVTSPTLSGLTGNELGDNRSFSGNPSSLSHFNLCSLNPSATNSLCAPAPTTFDGLSGDPSLDWVRERSTMFPLVSLTDTIYQNRSLIGTSSLNKPAVFPPNSHLDTVYQSEFWMRTASFNQPSWGGSSLTWTVNSQQNNQQPTVLEFADSLNAIFEQDPHNHTNVNMWNILEEQHALPQDTNSPQQVTNQNQGPYPPMADIFPRDANDHEIPSNVEPIIEEPIMSKGLNMKEHLTTWEYRVDDIEQGNQMDANLSTILENGTLVLNNLPGEVDIDVAGWMDQ